jgi:hypothetical protein
LKSKGQILILTILLTAVSACGKDQAPADDLTKDTIGIIETQVTHWFYLQQLPNGLLESVENSTGASLYDNALGAMVFMLQNDYEKAEKIFDFFNARIDSELNAGIGGFSQIRSSEGVPNRHRWMGDNAWLLIALNNYKARTGKSRYDNLSKHIRNWLVSLQDTDGGLFAGYDANGKLLNYKVTEGMIDAFNAVEGYTDFHKKLLQFLKENRWDKNDKNLVAWPENPPYLYALDLHPWSYLIFENYPNSALTTANRHLTTQKSTVTGKEITGYCFDEDRDAVWFEGTGQMTLAFHFANRLAERDQYLLEMEKGLKHSTKDSNASGFPYASNPGTHYGDGLLWNSADKEIAISGGAWYVFTKRKFNPFGVGRDKNIPREDMFWMD